MAGTNLVYDRVNAKTRRGLDNSKAKVWKKRMNFHAGIKLQEEMLPELMAEGHVPTPPQWHRHSLPRCCA